jgi:TRAP-type C4-dicarboxylate transport system permease small subunit
MIERFGMIHGWVIKTLTALATALLAPMMFLVTGDVIGRYFLNMPIPTVFEINSNFLMSIGVRNIFSLVYLRINSPRE